MARTTMRKTAAGKTGSPHAPVAPRPQSSANSELHRAPGTIDGETLPLRDGGRVHEFDAVDATTRLLLGGAAELTDLFLQVLENWESDVVEQNSATIVEQEEDLGDILRYLLIGLAFQSQRQVRSSTRTFGSWLLGAANTSLSVTRPIRQSWIFSPARRATDAVTVRLEDRIADLVSTGRSEEFVGRLVAENALNESVDWVMDYIAQNPEIRDLVQQQALGFTEEIAIGVRERSISAENVLDGILRKLFRRTPREELPGPPPEVKHLEETYDSIERGMQK